MNLSASSSTVYAKTDFGHLEIQGRKLGLAPALRRMLILVDGKRSGKELATLLAGQDTDLGLAGLVEQGCIEAIAKGGRATQTAKSTAAGPEKDSGDEAALAGLPPSHLRSEQQVDMARHFMINTVNMIFGQHTRLSLIEAISNCDDAETLRAVYPMWVETMSGSRTGVKRLPELRSKLFAVL